MNEWVSEWVNESINENEWMNDLLQALHCQWCRRFCELWSIQKTPHLRTQPPTYTSCATWHWQWLLQLPNGATSKRQRKARGPFRLLPVTLAVSLCPPPFTSLWTCRQLVRLITCTMCWEFWCICPVLLTWVGKRRMFGWQSKGSWLQTVEINQSKVKRRNRHLSHCRQLISQMTCMLCWDLVLMTTDLSASNLLLLCCLIFSFNRPTPGKRYSWSCRVFNGQKI